LIVLLHGAGSGANDILPLLQAEADRSGFLILAPQSEGATWDLVMGRPGADIGHLDRALEAVFSAYRVDRDRVAVAGFSDGGSYALSVGLANGGLFGHVLAFSPGFIPPVPLSGSPSIFISHGTEDPILPIQRCSRRIVPILREAGYVVDYREFLGGHVVPTEMVDAALASFLDSGDGGE
jgi:predicted esterase